VNQPIHLERMTATLASSAFCPGIVGTSQALVDVLQQVELVASHAHYRPDLGLRRALARS
jgi:hypothetical protein